MAKNEVIDKDDVWRDVIKSLGAMDGAGVYVGVQATEGKRPGDGIDAVELAAIHEFGSKQMVATKDGEMRQRIPERSFLRSTMDDQRTVYQKRLEEIARQAIVDPDSMAKNLGRLGLKAQADVRKKITDLKEPPNRPNTIRQKGSSNPLVDTGAMRNSISYKVET